MRSKPIFLIIVTLLSALFTACQANKQPREKNTNEKSVISITAGTPQLGAFLEGTYTVQKGTCIAEYQKLCVAKTGDATYDIYGLAGTEPIHFEMTNKNACFKWDESDCCLAAAEKSLTLTCTLPDTGTCESIYEMNTSTFDINTVFSTIESAAISALPLLADRQMDDIAAEATHEGINIIAIGTKEYAAFKEAKILLKDEKRLFKGAGLNIFVPAFAAPDDLKKYPFDLHKEVSCCSLIGARFVYDKGSAILYRLAENNPAETFGKYYVHVAGDVYSPSRSNESIIWFNSPKKQMTVMDYASSVTSSYALPVGVEVLDAAVAGNKIYILTRSGQVVDIREYDAQAKKWKPLGLKFEVPDPIYFSRVALLARGEAVAISLKNIFLIKTNPAAAWKNFKLRRGNMIIYMTADGLFASDTGRFYILDKTGGMKVSFTLDMFVHKQFETENVEMLPNAVDAYFEDASKLYFSISTAGQPTHSRYLGWLSLAQVSSEKRGF